MPDPLQNPAFRPPGILESLASAFLGSTRPLDCIQVEVSSCCQSRCSYCPRAIHAATWQARHMSPEIFASLWPVLRKSSRAHLQGWGEPLLNPSFFDFQALAARAGCATSTTTCGMVMDESLAAKLARCGLDIIAFSLAGTDNASNSARKGAPFEHVCANIRLLNSQLAKLEPEERPEVHLAYLLLPDRIAALDQLPALMAELDISCTVVSTMDYIADESQLSRAFLPGRNNAALRGKLNDIARRCQDLGRRFAFSLPEHELRPDGCRENSARTLFVSADGDISPCVSLNVATGRPQDKKRVFGNCLQKNAWDIWQQPDYRQFRTQLRATEPDPVCLGCAKRHEA